jgi:hypothetical protein
MEFDWTGAFQGSDAAPRQQIEESFEDPFSLRIMPDPDELPGCEARYFCIGRAVSSPALFSVFRTDGKTHRVIFSRKTTPEEEMFLDRKSADATA